MTPERERKLMAAKVYMATELKTWCDRFDLTGPELLGLLAHMTGAAIAFQDQRTVSREFALEIVMKNIEAGNDAAVEEVRSAGGSRH